MADIYVRFTIAAPRERVYKALTTQSGLASWWTSDTALQGDEIRLKFENGTIQFRMLVQKQVPPTLVEWDCVGDDPEWTGTHLKFVLSDADGKTALRFEHTGWKAASDYMADCGYTWPHVLERLKEYAETTKPVPFFV